MKAVMIRIGELWLKSEPVKRHFTSILIHNIRSVLDTADIVYRIEEFRGRILIYGDTTEIISHVSKVFGVYDVCICTICNNTPEDMISAAIDLAKSKLKPGMRFAVRAKRKYRGGIPSQELSKIIADGIWDEIPGFKVDLSNPEYEIYVESRENAGYVYDTRISCTGGLPLGSSSGKTLLLLSSGIDSPVAGWLMMRRGVPISCIFFNSNTWSGQNTKDLVLSNARVLSKWASGRNIYLYIVNMEQFFKSVHESCDLHYTCVICKRFMLNVANHIAKQYRYNALVSGENLGQVASQTLNNMCNITASTTIPIFRPLLTYDKEDIINISRNIGTFHDNPGDTKCRAVPPKPATESKIDKIEFEESKLDLDNLVSDACNSVEIWIARNGNISKKV